MGFTSNEPRFPKLRGARLSLGQRATFRVWAWASLLCVVVVVVGPVFTSNLLLMVRGPQTVSEAQLRTKLAQRSLLPNFTVPGRVNYVTLPGLPATAADFSVTDGEDDHLYDFRYVFLGNQVLVTKVEGYGPTLPTGEIRRLSGDTEAYARKGLTQIGTDVKLAPYLLDTTTNVQEKLATIVGLLGFALTFALLGFVRAVLWQRCPPKPFVAPKRTGIFVEPRQIIGELFRGPGSLRRFAVAGATVGSAVLVSAALVVAPASPTDTTTWSEQIKPLAQFVENLRGGPFEHPVPVDLLSPEQYDLVAKNAEPGVTTPCQESTLSKENNALIRAFCEDRESADNLRRATYSLLGVTQTERAQASLAHLRSIGFYSPIDKRLYVRGKRISPEVNTVLVHELTHAWQDQRFHLGLFRPKSTEALVAWQALVEGDASYVEQAYMKAQRGVRPMNALDQGLSDHKRAAQFRKTSNYVLANTLNPMLPYLAGPTYIKRLRQQGIATSTGRRAKGTEAIDLAFSHPPESIAQVFNAQSSPFETMLPLLQTNSPFEGEDATVVYEEQLDASSFFVLAGSSGSYRDLLVRWHGGVLQLATNGKRLCAQVTVRTSEALPPITIPQEDLLVQQLSFPGLEDRPPATYQPPEYTVVARRACWEGVGSGLTSIDTQAVLGKQLRLTLQSWELASQLATEDQTTEAMDRCFATALALRLDRSDSPTPSANEITVIARACQLPEPIIGKLIDRA
jgi:hypothetical protein